MHLYTLVFGSIAWLCFFLGSMFEKHWLLLVAALILSLCIIHHEWQGRRLLQAMKQKIQGLHPNTIHHHLWHELNYALDKLERKQTQQYTDMHSQQEDLQHMMQALPYGLVILGKDDTIEWFNPRACAYLQLDPIRDQQQKITYLVRQPDFIAFLACTQEVSLDLENHNKHLRIHRIPYAQNRQVLLLQDTSPQQKLDQIRRDFIEHASHELKTPLTMIIGWLEALQHLPLNEEQGQKYLHKISIQSVRMNELIHKLLSLAHLESLPEYAEHHRIDMRSLLERACREAKTLAHDEQSIQIEQLDTVALYGEYEGIYTSVMNLLKNALGHGPAYICVKVFWQASSEGYAELRVEDNGLGIPKQHLPYLTQRFYRASQQGHGLGLSIVKHHVKRHQGQVLISNLPTEGACFILRFPASRMAK